VLQPVEVIESGPRSTFVAYSLGNFIFDQTEHPDTRTGAVLRVLLDRRGLVGAWAAPTTMRGGRVRALAPGSRENVNALKHLGVP
jgi:poly-gamma-glutamate capsule biosynthesis protein CapA/YwtB (metallophosphatase superfamily)